MGEQVSATRAVVDFVTSVRLQDFPAEAIRLAKRCVIDGLGVMLAGSTTDGSRILRDFVSSSERTEARTSYDPRARSARHRL